MNDDAPAATPQQAAIVALPAEITFWNAAEVGRTLAEAISGSAGDIIVDLTDTEFCGISGIAALCAARRLASSHHTLLHAIVPPGPLARLFTVYGVDQIWAVHPTVSAALMGIAVQEA